MNRLTNNEPGHPSSFHDAPEGYPTSAADAGIGTDRPGVAASPPGAQAHSDQPSENPLVWRNDWAIGIPSLDADHRRLVELVNELLAHPGRDPFESGSIESGIRNEGGSAVTRFERLVDHLRGHFEREEALMLSIDYIDFQNHKCEHSLQLAELTDLRRQIPNTADAAFSLESLQWIKRWCFDHLVSEDRNLARAFAEITRP
jgi:hemerythrin